MVSALRRYMKKFVCLLLLFGCSHNVVPTKPVVTVPTPVIPVAVPAPIVIQPVVVQPVVSLDSITSLAEKSSCMNYKWKDRGTAPRGFIKGVALAYAHEVCFPNKIVNSPLGSSDKDVLVHYGLKVGAVNIYALMIGSGMRESSGKYCEGRDMSASNTTASSAEAGAWQTSYDSHKASVELDALFKDYSNNKHNCYDVFKEGLTCTKSNLDNYGSGDGLKFQQMAKSCPAFAAAYAAVTFRVLYKHYGPLITKAAEFKPECVDMLTAVEVQVKAKPEICNLL